MDENVKIIEVENGNDKIGFNIDNNTFNIYIPKYYINNQSYNLQTKEKLKKMFKAWEKYQKRSKSLLGNKYITGDSFYDLVVAMDIIQDYVENGLFIEQENCFVISNLGKMNFKKTITKCNPLYTEQGPIFLKYVINSKKEDEECLLKIIQQYTLKDISKKIGWMIGFYYNVNIDNVSYSNKEFVKKLKEIKNQSFNSRKLHLIDLLIKYYSNVETENGGSVFIGMANLFWQDMINEVVGNVKKNELQNLFYVKHAYVISNNDIKELPPLMPDSIYRDSKNIIVIDSKYYINDSRPTNDDINKQFIYMLKAAEITNNHENYSNCFILPTDKENDYGSIKAIFDKDVKSNNIPVINVLYANLEQILDKYIKNEKDTNIIKDLII